MSTVEYNFEMEGFHCPGTPRPLTARDVASAQVSRDKCDAHGLRGDGPQAEILNRIAEVRRQQGVSTRSAARKLGLTPQEIRDQEDPTADLRISQLVHWQSALDVPVVDLLVDSGGALSEPISLRARLLRVMKTAKAIQEVAKDKGIQRMSTMLIEQLVDLMPELRDVSPWHSVGQRRTQDEMGRIADHTIPDSFFGDAH